ncbi:homoserine kinase [Prochlorothrix hollandica]|uniref:homoserine kinase n=1 Tax=Prochlorothrix hollandica TaxID=1223 RepID=UPI00334122AE
MAITVTVPATTANLGPGFDCLGAALSLYNSFTFSLLAPETQDYPQIFVEGSGSSSLSLGSDNLLYQAIVRFYQALGQTPPPLHISIQMGVPLARGLGSSATAIVGGLVGANVLAGEPLGPAQIRDLAIELEGHPDNVVPAQQGGCCLAATGIAGDQDWQISEVPWHPALVPVVAIPQFELSTEKARQVLPSTYSRADAIFNAAHVGLLLRGLDSGHGPWLRAALQDRIHQPYRQSLIPGFAAVHQAAIAAGAYGLVISGAGPTLLALTTPDKGEGVAQAMAQAWESAQATVQVLALDRSGAKVQVT